MSVNAKAMVDSMFLWEQQLHPLKALYEGSADRRATRAVCEPATGAV
jgi:hypothetical protein